MQWRSLKQACLPLYRSASSVAGGLSAPSIYFSGIQPTGVPHLGNYLGAIRQWVILQRDLAPSTKLLFSIVNGHAHTVPQEKRSVRQWSKETLAVLLATGLDPKRCILFYQLDVKGD